jgi:hypothetical protein
MSLEERRKGDEEKWRRTNRNALIHSACFAISALEIFPTML